MNVGEKCKIRIPRKRKEYYPEPPQSSSGNLGGWAPDQGGLNKSTSPCHQGVPEKEEGTKVRSGEDGNGLHIGSVRRVAGEKATALLNLQCDR